MEAGGEEFAEKGFDAARVRRICVRAKANGAAINYYFGDKVGLYIEAVLEAHRCGAGVMISEDVFSDLEPAEQLKMFIHHFLANVLAVKRDTWHHALMIREMLRPSTACETMVRESIRPRFERLYGIMKRICPGAEERRLQALTFSVIGQCLHYKVARPISERLIGLEAYEALDLAFLTDHITTFSLAALGQGTAFDRDGRSKELSAAAITVSTG